jgi:hypothetical protein
MAVGFTAKVNANNGINNTPGSELVNISVPSCYGRFYFTR